MSQFDFCYKQKKSSGYKYCEICIATFKSSLKTLYISFACLPAQPPPPPKQSLGYKVVHIVFYLGIFANLYAPKKNTFVSMIFRLYSLFVFQ